MDVHPFFLSYAASRGCQPLHWGDRLQMQGYNWQFLGEIIYLHAVYRNNIRLRQALNT